MSSCPRASRCRRTRSTARSRCIAWKANSSLIVQRDGAEQRQPLRAGQLCYLEGGVVHTVTGVVDASALVTIVLKR